MLIHLTEIFASDTGKAHLKEKLDLGTVVVDGVTYPFLEPVEIEAVLKRVGPEKMLAEGKVRTSLEIPCGRCMKPVAYRLESDFSKALYLEEASAEGVEDDYEEDIVGHHLNLENFALHEIFMNFPMKVLCGEDCKGICNHCGADLNETDCQCGQEAIDPRLSGLKDLLNSKFKEV
ncbi:YceD family protein [Anaerotalea alkaliphila]|uniref:DUF177 domain-containing protein n=1 Tax=Anaerotalea alkaliphila TaxID=2662126 RepID=A0A7X5KNL3_9FIRM|nr:DUF177 domain-containing protein [Anaerotalea alkaliphila]NDL66872.1 DUF177 domain-containing protein [Anaerotalea alkaliphila]